MSWAEQLEAGLERLTLANRAVLKAHVHEDVSFSGITQYRLRRLLNARGLQEGQAALPDSIRRLATDVAPHKWAHNGEVSESPDLLERLQREVCSAGHGRPALGNCFMDVQSLNSSGPMTRTVCDSTGERTVSGVPDLAILELGLDASTVVSPFSNTCAVVDWKPPDKVGMPKAGWQVMTQAIVLAGDDGNGSPAFVTDLVQGFAVGLSSTPYSFTSIPQTVAGRLECMAG